MKLYEATNGYTGYSDVRCFVWAKNEAEAIELAKKAYEEADSAKVHGERYWSDIELQLIVDSEKDIEPFYTEPTD